MISLPRRASSRFCAETVQLAESIVYRAEASLGPLTDGQAADLLCDNTDIESATEALALVKQSREPHDTRYKETT